jgi:hypothetical protein
MIADLAHGVDEWVLRGAPATRASTFGFRDGKLAVVVSVNPPLAPASSQPARLALSLA